MAGPGHSSNACLPDGQSSYFDFPYQPALCLDESTLGLEAGKRLFFSTAIDSGKETFLSVTPILGPEVPVPLHHTINMEYAH